MSKLFRKGQHLVSLEELERHHLARIETILSQNRDGGDSEQIDDLCFSICCTRQGISQASSVGGQVIMFNRRRRSLELWCK